jgi:hypothetical protein
MIYKPQFGLILPVVLLAGGHYRAIAGAMLAAGLLVAATLVAFDSGVWAAFVHSLPLTQSVIIEQGAAGWEKIQSAFSAARWWGASIGLAWAIQTGVTVAAVMSGLFVARGVKSDVRNVVVVAAALLSTPYVLDYDLVPLSVAIAFMVRDGRARGFLSYEKSLLALVWGMPLVGRIAFQATGLPIDLISVLTMAGLALRRAWVFDRSWVVDAGDWFAARLPAGWRLA